MYVCMYVCMYVAMYICKHNDLPLCRLHINEPSRSNEVCTHALLHAKLCMYVCTIRR